MTGFYRLAADDEDLPDDGLIAITLRLDGAKPSIRLVPLEPCPTCDGSGLTPEDHGAGRVEMLGCQDCRGIGVLL